MRAPIVVVEGNDIGVFLSIEGAESSIEPIDVRSDIYRIFDATGIQLRADIHKLPGLLAPERIRLSPTSFSDSDFLVSTLRQYLSEATKKECPLDTLLAILVATAAELAANFE